MGRFSYTGMNTVVMQAEVGAFCSCAWNVTIGGANHDVSRVTQHAFLYNPYDGIRPEGHPAPYDRFAGKITIGHDVWIGAGAAIMRGVSVGNGAVIAANAVVTRDVPPYAIVAGNPARILRSRFPDAIVDRLQALQWWHWDVADLQAKYDLISAEPTPEVLDQLETG
ncbi:CatB-related O-acetyltransferase (plasmid) [Jannaschia sp. M317]|nr:CatB-related O-acetyltransferase [Jannaschia sp. M317]